jgi:hypothetical protein
LLVLCGINMGIMGAVIYFIDGKMLVYEDESLLGYSAM